MRERGTHQNLLADSNTFYSYLWSKQNEAQTPIETADNDINVNELKTKYDFPVPEAMGS